MSTTSLNISKQYASFSGVDIRIIIEGVSIGSAQAMSYAIQREKAPIYVMGRVDPLSFSRGKRGIAGTMITLMLDHHVLKSEPFTSMKFVADNDEIYSDPSSLVDVTPVADGGLDDLTDVGGFVTSTGDVSENYSIQSAWYVDQIPPFDAAIVAMNEYGNASTMRVYGIEILNEGSGFSIDDIVIENQMTYVCRTLLPWQKLGSWDFTTQTFQPQSPTSKV